MRLVLRGPLPFTFTLEWSGVEWSGVDQSGGDEGGEERQLVRPPGKTYGTVKSQFVE